MRFDVKNLEIFICIGGAIGSKLEPTSPLLQEIRLCP